MTRLRVLLSRVRGLFRDANPRLDEELSTHLDLLTAEYQSTGLSQEEARAAARRDLGPTTQIREIHRGQRRPPLIDSIFQDLRYTFRQWRAHRAFAATAILTLALGIGANSAIFQLLDRIVLRSLPVRDPQQLVVPQGYWNDGQQGFSYPLVREMNARQSVVEGIFASGGAPIREVAVDGRVLTEVPSGRLATGNYFRLIGTTPQAGRFFAESDDNPAAPAVAVLSDGFWRTEFGGRASAIGSTIRINDVAVTIIGITRPEFFGERVGSAPALWMPMSMAAPLGSPGDLTASTIWLTPMARLRNDVPRAQAQAQLSVLWDQLREFSIRRTDVNVSYRLALLPGRQGLDTLQTQFSRPLWILMGLVGLVALIACSNLANLLLARATARAHEMGVRLALGAGRARLLRQLLTESFALATLGGALGLALASLASRQLITLASAGDTWELPTGLDWRIAGFTLLATLISVLIFGLAPAFAATRIGLNAALHATRRTHTGGSSSHTATRTFVIAQVSLSLLLVAGASLLVRSFWKLTHQEFGYQTESLLMVTLNNNGGSFQEFFAPPFSLNLARRVREIPGVSNAAVSASGLLSGFAGPGGRLSVADRVLPASVVARIVPVTPGYLETMGIAVVRGRSLTDDDRIGSPRVAVISETAARLMFGSADPIGQKFSSGAVYRPNFAFEVVGIMHDIRYGSPREPLGALAFGPAGQLPMATAPTLVVRTMGDPAFLAPALEQLLSEIAPKIKIARIQAVHDLVQTQARRERLLAWLSGAFGILALLLAGVGLYGVIAYAAESRSQEMGIRLALGARPQQVRALLLKEVGILLAIGLTLGGAATLLLGRALGTLLFDLTPHDPATLVFAAALLSVIGFAAGYMPARRAARLDPMTALRAE